MSSEDVQRFTFTAELAGKSDESDDWVRFSYLGPDPVELLLPRVWWTGIGSPQSIAVTVEPEPE